MKSYVNGINFDNCLILALKTPLSVPALSLLSPQKKLTLHLTDTLILIVAPLFHFCPHKNRTILR